MEPPENWRGSASTSGSSTNSPGGRCRGFKVLEVSRFDPEAAEVREIWNGPRFDAPLLGLTNASAGEIIVAARPLLDSDNTINRAFFEAAIDEQDDPQEALALWLACLQAGDSMAHFALGYTLYELGRYHDAYRHLRHYAEIAPCHAWNWCWFGKAAAAPGERDEAAPPTGGRSSSRTRARTRPRPALCSTTCAEGAPVRSGAPRPTGTA